MNNEINLYAPFVKWGALNNIWVLSDLHLDDEDRLLSVPDWISGMEQVDIINKFVLPDDTLLCLGDVGDATLVPRIKAKKKILLLGNHDKREDYEGLFDEIYEGPLFISDRILLSHEPVSGLKWCLNIHGHCHSGKEYLGEGCRHVNMSSNLIGYTPIRLKELLEENDVAGLSGIHVQE